MTKLGRIYNFFKQLPENIRSINTSLDNVAQNQDLLGKRIDKTVVSINESLNDYGGHIEKIEATQADLRHAISALESRPKTTPGGKKNVSQSSLQADNHSLDSYYVAFEDKFRGTEDDIYARLKKSYSTFLKKDLPTSIKKLPLIDIGCGRGELLRLYKELGYKGVGVDLNESMVKKCQKSGYQAEQIDALEYLKSRPSSSIGGVSGIHIVEHIPFENLIELLREAFRVTAKGGFILLETPNPENLTVGSFNFWYDTSHLKPLPPELLAFMLEYVGFGDLKTLRMQPEKDKLDSIPDSLTQEMAIKLYGPRDYAVIGFKFDSRSSQVSK